MLDDLISRIKRQNERADAVKVDSTIASPDWALEPEFDLIRSLIFNTAISLGQKGPTVIPAVAKQLKAVDVDVVVTRDGQVPISVVAYTLFGAIVVWWDRESLTYWMAIHEVAHPAAEEEIQFNSSLPVPRREVPVIERRGFFDKLGDSLSKLLGR